MEFTLFGEPFEVSEGVKNYIEILRHFTNMGELAKKEFRDEYNTIFSLVFTSSSYWDKFMSSYGKNGYMDNIVRRYVKNTRQYLTKFGIYDLSDDTIWEKGILAEDRARSRLEYELNVFMTDVINDEDDDNDIVPRIKRRFESDFFPACLYNDIMSMCDFVIKYVDENTDKAIQFVYKSNAETAETYYQNLTDSIVSDDRLVEIMASVPQGLSSEEFAAECEKRMPAAIDPEQKKKMARTMIEYDPRKPEYYSFIFSNIPEARYEIFKIANYLGFDLGGLANEEINKSFVPSSAKTEQEALEMMSKLKEEMAKYGITSCTVMTKLSEALKQFDIQARTYDGVLYESREKCAKAASDDKELTELCGEITSLDKEKCRTLITAVSEADYTDSIRDKYISKLTARIEAADKQYLDKLTEALGNASEDRCNEVKRSIAEYDAPDETKKPYIQKADRAYLDLVTRDLSAEDVCITAKSKIAAYDAPDETKNIYIQKADKAYLDLVTADLSTEELCNTAKSKIAAYDAAEEIKASYIGKVDTKIYAIWDEEDFERFKGMFLSISLHDSSAVKDTLEYVKSTGRTKPSKELLATASDHFIAALANVSEENITTAAKYANAKKKGTLASIINMGKSKIYNYLTFDGKIMHPDIIAEMEKEAQNAGKGILGGLGGLFGKK